MANFAPGSYVSRSYTILSTASGFTGTFDALRTVGLPRGFATSLSYTANTALLNIRARLVPEGPGGQPPTGGLIPGGAADTGAAVSFA